MTHFLPIVRDALFFVALVAAPILVLLPRIKKRKAIGKAVVISVFLTWLLLVLHVRFVHIPISSAIANARGDRVYDGAAMRVGMEFFGWIPAIASTAGIAGGQILIRRRQKHDNAA
jgi:hypothetical protein